MPFREDIKRADRDNAIDVYISDAFFPFGDNIDRAAKSGVNYIAQPGGSSIGGGNILINKINGADVMISDLRTYDWKGTCQSSFWH